MNEDSLCSVAGIILAAGGSSRMHRIKQLLPFHGKPLLSHVLENAALSNLSEVIVVLGRSAARIRPVLNAERFPKVRIILNRDWDKGQSTSVKAGLAAISGRCEGAMCLLGDQPLVDASVIDAIVNKFQQTRGPLVIPTCGGRRGNPVVIHRSLFNRLQGLSGNVGARILFDEYAEQIVEIEVASHGIHLDIDTWEDYLRLKRAQTSKVVPGNAV